MPHFVHMDIAADDPERAARFYNRVFGWSVTKLEGPVPYWLVTPPADAAGPGAGIAKRELAWQGITPTIEVPSADDYTAKIVAEGGTIVTPKTPIPGVGNLVTFKDPEGNVLAILEAAAENAFVAPPSGQAK
ncbi:MAG: VOC family protein [Devosia nanyangense]|uniref:VOC family protein n=1 Tax=Devosia nanyangense TaxID=1228055 RepID=A0A933L3Q2_9HYPH|nr:VOC family protein [Devosia nanyangense]